jgi:predicted nucleic acid-binding protein
VGIEELQQQALEIAIHLNHSIYDCFYLALAERERCASITADAKLLAAAKKMKAKARLL